MSDTYVSSESLQAAMCAAATACRYGLSWLIDE